MQSYIVDAHYDLLCDVFRLRRKGERKVIERFYHDDWKSSGFNVLICSLFVSDAYLPEMALKVAMEQIGMLHCEMEESPGLFALCRSAADVEKTVRSGRTALLLSFEGVEPLGKSLVLLRAFYELGVRFVGLTWSRRNYAADGCHFRPIREGAPGGLTSFGVSLLEEAERLGMIIDVSHLNDAGFADVAKFATKPFIASHSNARSLCGVARNLTDGQIAALSSSGGVIGLNNMINFVFPKDGETGGDGCEGLLKHARHMIELVGPDHVGFGLDLCEFEKPEDARDRSVFPTYRHTRPFIELVRREFSSDISDKILGGNWMRVIDTLR